MQEIGHGDGEIYVKKDLEEIKDEISISYLEDIFVIIMERKAIARTVVIARSSLTDVLAEPRSITPEPSLKPASLSSNQSETSSAIGK